MSDDESIEVKMEVDQNTIKYAVHQSNNQDEDSFLEEDDMSEEDSEEESERFSCQEDSDISKQSSSHEDLSRMMWHLERQCPFH